ncbi:MAG: hypothetical protein WCF23_10810 [Candidatus Nitrosopolaris sp.]
MPNNNTELHVGERQRRDKSSVSLRYGIRFICTFCAILDCPSHHANVIRITAMDAPEIKHRRETILVGKI